MKYFPSTFFAVSSLAAIAQAVPKVTPVLVEGGCGAYPLYGPGTAFVAHFALRVNQCTDPKTSEPCPVDGHGGSIEPRRVEGEERITQGYITSLNNKMGAPIRLQCDGDKGFVEAQSYDPAGGESDYIYNKIAVVDTPASANMMWGLPDDATIPIEPYRHHVDGEEQEGTFLGSQNVTTWGIKEYKGDDGQYWLFRLLGPGSEDKETGKPLKEGEYETFIKVADY